MSIIHLFLIEFKLYSSSVQECIMKATILTCLDWNNLLCDEIHVWLFVKNDTSLKGFSCQLMQKYERISTYNQVYKCDFQNESHVIW